MAETEDLLKQVKLRFVSDSDPGITRQKKGEGFTYLDSTDKSVIKDQSTLDRIDSLAIPPAWENVWICAKTNGYLQATGIDQKGRKQYRYHPDFIEISQEQKYLHILDFAKVLPKIRSQVKKDLKLEGLPKAKILATIVWLLENTLIRVGNEEYAEDNKHYGLTTFKNRHAEVEGSTVKFSFKGKSGVYHEIEIKDKRVAKIIKKSQDLPGQQLFEYLDDGGKRETINSEDVNEYLKEISGTDVTAKDFRTWAGTNIAAQMLDEVGECPEKTTAKKNISTIVKSVAKHLGNKPNTCRKYYIHPIIFNCYQKGFILSNLTKYKKYKRLDSIKDLDDLENQVLSMINTFS